MKIRRDLEVNFETWKAMLNGCTEATVGVRFAKRGVMPVTPNIRDCAEKYLDDDTTETEFASGTGTRKPSNRGDRRRATMKAKRHLREIYNHPFYNDSVRAVVRNGNEVAYVREGDTWSWRKEWRRMNHRIRRHEGKRECYEYIPEAIATETETPFVDDLHEEYIDMYVFQSVDAEPFYERKQEEEERFWNEPAEGSYEWTPSNYAAMEFIREKDLLNEFYSWMDKRR